MDKENFNFQKLTPTNNTDLSVYNNDLYLPLYNSKHTEDGFWDRVEVLEEFYDKTREFVSYISSHQVLKSHQVDCMDALCLAVSGLLGLNNGFTSIPNTPAKDARGLNMEIAYGKKESELK